MGLNVLLCDVIINQRGKLSRVQGGKTTGLILGPFKGCYISVKLMNCVNHYRWIYTQQSDCLNKKKKKSSQFGKARPSGSQWVKCWPAGSFTWYDLKQVSARFVWIGCELVDLAALQRDAALKHKQRANWWMWLRRTRWQRWCISTGRDPHEEDQSGAASSWPDKIAQISQNTSTNQDTAQVFHYALPWSVKSSLSSSHRSSISLVMKGSNTEGDVWVPAVT